MSNGHGRPPRRKKTLRERLGLDTPTTPAMREMARQRGLTAEEMQAGHATLDPTSDIAKLREDPRYRRQMRYAAGRPPVDAPGIPTRSEYEARQARLRRMRKGVGQRLSGRGY